MACFDREEVVRCGDADVRLVGERAHREARLPRLLHQGACRAAIWRRRFSLDSSRLAMCLKCWVSGAAFAGTPVPATHVVLTATIGESITHVRKQFLERIAASVRSPVATVELSRQRAFVHSQPGETFDDLATRVMASEPRESASKS